MLASCGTPSADSPDLGIAPKPCPPSLQVDLPAVPDVPDHAGIVKPPVGSKAATATGVYLDYVARLNDTANELLKRAADAKTFCDAR
jgi:hypothetical protein